MKRKIFIVLGIVVFCFAAATSFYFTQKQTNHVEVQVPVVPSVSVTLDTGEKISTVSGIRADNAFTALESASKQQHLELKTKQYDFGVFVEQIGTLANTKEKSWIYAVNGKSGEVASDKYQLKQSDSVEWKYTTPLY